MRWASLAGDAPPGRGAAGEADLVDLRVEDEGVGHLGLGRQQVDHPGGEADLGGAFGDDEGLERRLRGGLDHDRAAGDEGRGDLDQHQEQRPVPRPDRGDDADWLGDAHTPAARIDGRHLFLPLDLVDQPGVHVEEADAEGRARQRAAVEGNAHLPRPCVGQLVHVVRVSAAARRTR